MSLGPNDGITVTRVVVQALLGAPGRIARQFGEHLDSALRSSLRLEHIKRLTRSRQTATEIRVDIGVIDRSAPGSATVNCAANLLSFVACDSVGSYKSTHALEGHNRSMDMQNTIKIVRGFDGALVVQPKPRSDLPDISWGDAYLYHAPDGVMRSRTQSYGRSSQRTIPTTPAGSVATAESQARNGSSPAL